jgi:hypothetical protein
MKQDMRNNSPFVFLKSEVNKIFNQLSAEKRKTVFAVCLIVLVVFMWARVPGGKTPKSAEATLEQRVVISDASAPSPGLKVTFIELPKVAGRNDSITRDFFASDDWWKFIVSREGEK